MGAHVRYANYKPSGVDWLGDVPDHWVPWKVTHGFQAIGSGTTPKSDNFSYYEGEIPWITTSELRETVVYETAKRISEEAFESHSALKLYGVGSLAIAMYGATIGRLGVFGVEATVNQACCVFSEPTVFDTSFVYYWLWMRRPILISLSSGGGQPNLSQDDLKKLKIPIPEIPEQQAIARFLDYKTAQIDALIAKKQTLLDKLAEKRVALATQAITEGLNELVERNSSGVPWLSKMPAHWGFKRLRFLTTMDGGMTPSTGNAEYWDGDIPWVSPKDMKRERLHAVPDNLTARALQDTGIRLHDSGRVLIVVRGMILAHTFPVAINDVPVTINQDMKALSPILDADYLALVLRGLESVVLSIVEESAHGTKVMRTDLFKNLVLPVPPMEEQRDIVRAIQALTQESDKMATAVSSAISKLQEYRSSLITHAVTGQIDVRHVPIPVPAHA
jgi:type I restriction enzyme, S subunit